ncbi:MAG: response regulator [Geobacter sp.]|nr:MAG: response regulator [Geobacter sp.]
MEAQLIHAQKMESVGTLAGGVAHDFNNILTVIIGNGSIIEMKMAPNDPLTNNVQQILAAANRAAGLTQSLLAFSRKTPIEPRPVNLNDILNKVERLLTRLLREDIEYKSALTGEELTIMADTSQMEQVVMNLATNARDAMPKGGLLRISTAVVELDQAFISVYGYGTPGRYAALSCSDNGAGMDRETVQRVFEPFFTTKEVGKGTGLGLAIVYGIIKQHNGYINCYSEPGKGTTFRIYLPLMEPAPIEEPIIPEGTAKGGSETILVAEDDDAARKLARQILETYGYMVIEAVDGEDAVAKFIEHQKRIDLAILDVIMPKKNGKAACDEILKLRPGLKCIFTSGYAADILDEQDKKDLNFIPKPIIPNMLLKKIREILDS